MWGLYATYTWTAGPGLSSLQAVRFYLPAIGAISLLGAWLVVRLVTRLPDRAPLAAVTTAAVVAAMFGLGLRSFNDMRTFRFGPPASVPCNIGQPRCRAGSPHGVKGRGPAIQAPGG